MQKYFTNGKKQSGKGGPNKMWKNNIIVKKGGDVSTKRLNLENTQRH